MAPEPADMAARPLAIPLRWQLAGLVLPLGLCGWLSWRVVHAKAPERLPAAVSRDGVRFGMSERERQAIYADIARHDPEWWERTRRFPDAWSQHDDYHIHLSRHVAALAQDRKLPVEAVFLIYDEGLRKHWHADGAPPLDAAWVPLRPRTQ